MVSPEILRRYPFFAFLNLDQLADIAMLTDELDAVAGQVLFEIGDAADALYLLRDGNVELQLKVVDERGMERPQDFLVGMINPGEILGISALIEPYKYGATAVVTEPSKLLRMDGPDLRAACDSDAALAAGWLRQTVKATMSRLQDTRVQLLAAS